MTHLPMILHALNVEKEAAVQVRLNPLTLTLLSIERLLFFLSVVS